MKHPNDWRWHPRLARWEHPHARTTIAVIEPGEEPEHGKPNAAFGFGRELKAPAASDEAWEGMGL